MLLGIGLHASLAFFPSFWPVQDSTTNIDGLFDEFLAAIHGFRMPLFFLLSGFFTAMLWRLAGVKFPILTVGVSAVLLAGYRLFVRYTPTGTMLNGKRTRPGKEAAVSSDEA